MRQPSRSATDAFPAPPISYCAPIPLHRIRLCAVRPAAICRWAALPAIRSRTLAFARLKPVEWAERQFRRSTVSIGFLTPFDASFRLSSHLLQAERPIFGGL